MKYNKLFYIQLMGLLFLMLILILAIPKYSEKIPNTLVSRVSLILSKNSLDWVSIRSEGRDIILSGLSPSIEEHYRVIKLCNTVFGIRTIYDKISPIVISPYKMNINYDGKRVILDGYLPSIKSKKELFTKLKEIYKSNIVDKVDIGAGEPILWTQFIYMVVSNIKNLDFTSINIIDNRLYISGKIETEKELKKLEDTFQNFQNSKKSKFIIINHIVPMDRPANICQTKFDVLLKKNKIEFESGTSIIKNNKNLIQELSDISLLCPEVNIEITGYTDSVGDVNKNLKLSLERAKVVVAKLFGLGVALDRMIAKGEGENHPIASNKSSYGRAKNRRIEFRVLNK